MGYPKLSPLKSRAGELILHTFCKIVRRFVILNHRAALRARSIPTEHIGEERWRQFLWEIASRKEAMINSQRSSPERYFVDYITIII